MNERTTPTNKGAGIAVAVDWLSATVLDESPGRLARDVDFILATGWVGAPGRHGYARSFAGDHGARILFSPGRGDLHVVLPGAWCTAAGEERIREALSLFERLGATVRRCDLAATDEHRLIEPKDLVEAIERGELVSRATARYSIKDLSGTEAITVYVGSASSRRQLRVYDKTAESSGRVTGVRWELTARKETAHLLAKRLRLSLDWSEIWPEALVSFVDFREVRAGAQSDRRSRAIWFERFVGAPRRVSAYPPTLSCSSSVNIEWLEVYVAPSLARLVAEHDGDLTPIHQLVALGSRKIGLPMTADC